MKIELVKTPTWYQIKLTDKEQEEVFQAADVLRRLIPSKYRRFDLDEKVYQVDFRAAPQLKEFLSRFSNAEIVKRDESNPRHSFITPQTINRLRELRSQSDATSIENIRGAENRSQN